jgi:hypothetical protein
MVRMPPANLGNPRAKARKTRKKQQDIFLQSVLDAWQKSTKDHGAPASGCQILTT